MKNKFKKRPFLFFALAMISGIITAYLLILLRFIFLLKIFNILLILTNIFLFIYIIFYTDKDVLNKIIILTLPLLLLTGSLKYSLAEYKYYRSYLKFYSETENEYVNVIGVLSRDLGNVDGNYYYIKAKKINDEPADNIKIQVQKDKFISFKHNSIISCDLVLIEPAEKLNPGGFSYKNHLKKQNILFQSFKIKNIYLIKQRFSAKKFLINIKNKIIFLIEDLFSKKIRNFLKAILLGEKAGIGYETELLLKESGASHLLALSGLHVGIIIISLKSICSKVIKNNNISLILISITTGIYVVLVGASVSIIRAALLTLLFLWSKVFYRDGDFINILALTIIINLFINPYALFTISLQLSYLIVLSIYLLTDFLNKIFPKILSVSIAAQLGAVAISAYYFGEYAYIGIVTNIWLIPLIAVLLPLSFFVILSAPIFYTVVLILLPILEFSYYLMFKGLEFMRFIQGEMLVLSQANIILIILYYTLLFSLPYLFKKKIIPLKLKKYKVLKYISTCLFIIIFSLIILDFPSKLLEINFLAVGQGDGIYIKFPNNKNMIIDTGPPGKDGRQVEYNIISFLNYKGIKKIDYLIISHFDSDHSGGLKHLLKRKKINNILISEHKENVDIDYLKKIAEQNNYINLYYITEFAEIMIDKCYLNFLNPPQNKVFEDKNENSIVFNLKYGKYNFLFTGDLSKKGEHRILDEHNLSKINILKLGHHGSSTSTSSRLLDELKPDLAVISVGKNNYGHPDIEVLDKLKQRNIKYLRTDKNGAVTIRTNGNNINFETFIK